MNLIKSSQEVRPRTILIRRMVTKIFKNSCDHINLLTLLKLSSSICPMERVLANILPYEERRKQKN